MKKPLPGAIASGGQAVPGQILAGGASCVVNVGFSDFSGLLRIGTLDVASTPGGAVTVNLSGSNLD